MSRAEGDAPGARERFPEVRDHTTAALLESLGSTSFPRALQAFIRPVCDFDSIMIFRFLGAAPPVTLYHDLDEIQATISVHFYASGPYLLDPFYQACRNGSEPGPYRLLDLVSKSFLRSEYYRTYYRQIRISDEMGLLIPQTGDGWFLVSLARVGRRPRFSEEDVGRVNGIFRTVAAAVLKHWGDTPARGGAASDEAIEDRLESFGAEQLSPREGEVVRLILQGHSTPSVAAFLGIAEGTVKVHRHSAYAKLGVSSQAELFSLATRHFLGGKG